MTALHHGTSETGHRRVAVDDVTVVLLTHPGGPVVTQALDALRGQGLPVRRVVLTGLDGDEEEVRQAAAHPLVREGVDLLVRPRLHRRDAGSPAAVLEDARADLPVDERHWLWVLHDDTLPERGALAALARPTLRTTRVGIVGPKLVDLDDPRRLLAVGHRVTPGGRDADGALPGQFDQGQHDARADVLGVPLAGMLVRSDVLDRLGGLEPAFDEGAEGLDLSWRSHLAGYRVLVAPDAVVRQGPDGRPSRPLRTRTRLRQVALARGPWWTAPGRGLAVLATAVPAVLVLLLLKRPRAAAGALADVRAVLSPWRGLAARWRFGRRRSVPHSSLAALFAPAGAGWRSAPPVRRHPGWLGAAGGPAAAPALDTGPVSDEASSPEPPPWRSWWSWPLVASVLLVAAACVVRWRDLAAGLSPARAGVSGGELLPVLADGTALWHSWWDGWRGAGLGEAVAQDPGGGPWLAPVSALAWVVGRLPAVEVSPVGVTLTWLLATSPVLAALSAYAATRVATPSRWVRAGAALAWAALAPLQVAVAHGRLGPAVAHVLLPAAVAAAVSAATRRGGRGTAAAAGAALALAGAAAFAPVVLLLAVVAGLLVLVLGRRWLRLRGLLVGGLPWLLLGPWAVPALQDPRLLLGGPGGTTTGPAPAAWQTLLLHPGGASAAPVWWTAPLLLLAVVATALGGSRGRRAAALVLGAVMGLGLALLAPWVLIGVVPPGLSDAGSPVTPWPGTLLSAAGACLLLAACLGAGALTEAAAMTRVPGAGGAFVPPPPPRRAGGRVLACLAVAAATLAVPALAASAWDGAGESLRPTPHDLPPVVAEQAGGAESVRTLVIVPRGREATYRLVGHEAPAVQRDRAAEIVAATGASAPDPAQHELARLAARIAGGTSAEPSADLHRRLHDLAVGYVVVRAGEDADAAPVLDTAEGLARIRAPEGQLAWRVAATGEEDAPVPVARLRLADLDGTPRAALPSPGAHSATSTALPGTGAQALVVSEAQEWARHAVVTVDGRVLAPAGDGWPVTYLLPEHARQLTIELRPAAAGPWAVTAALWGLVAFLALPVGRGRRTP